MEWTKWLPTVVALCAVLIGLFGVIRSKKQLDASRQEHLQRIEEAAVLINEARADTERVEIYDSAFSRDMIPLLTDRRASLSHLSTEAAHHAPQ